MKTRSQAVARIADCTTIRVNIALFWLQSLKHTTRSPFWKLVRPAPYLTVPLNTQWISTSNTWQLIVYVFHFFQFCLKASKYNLQCQLIYCVNNCTLLTLNTLRCSNHGSNECFHATCTGRIVGDRGWLEWRSWRPVVQLWHTRLHSFHTRHFGRQRGQQQGVVLTTAQNPQMTHCCCLPQNSNLAVS